MIEERPIGVGLNRNLGSQTAPGEAVEQELDAFISRRHDQRQRTEDTDGVWQESVRRYEAARSEENRLAWRRYHEEQAERLRRTVGPLIAFHEERAAQILEGAPCQV